MNYCPVCKREYRQLNRNQTGLCPVCGSRLRMISDEALEKVRNEKKDR
jgi:rRNA maturation endonuclease Nob1